MQAISVFQPWAWATARGHRPLENRAWTTAHRGRLLIHASMRIDLAAFDDPLIRDAGWDPADPLAVLGAIVAVADLTDVCQAEVTDGGGCDCGEWAQPGKYHWHLDDVRPLPRPVVAVGRLVGLWTPRTGVLDEVRTMLDDTPAGRPQR